MKIPGLRLAILPLAGVGNATAANDHFGKQGRPLLVAKCAS